MADTPNLPPPIDAREQPVLESLRNLRDQLTLLKQDRTTYIKSSDVTPLYEKVVAQVKVLNDLRADKPHEDNQGTIAKQNRCILETATNFPPISRPNSRWLLSALIPLFHDDWQK